MSFIDKLFPNRKSKIINKREYSASKINRLTSDWVFAPVKWDDDIYSAIRTVRNRARDLYKNDDYARRFVNLCQMNIVGNAGFMLQVKSKDDNGIDDVMANQWIEDAWTEWGKPENCTITGRLSFRELCMLLVLHASRDGEFLAKKLFNSNSKFGFQLQVLEPDMLVETLNQYYSNNSEIKMGVETVNQKPIAYHIAEVLNEYSTSARRVPASEIIHGYRQESAFNVRGMSWLTNSMTRIKMLAGYEEASLVNARASASKMGFFETSADGGEYTGQDKDANGNIISSAEAGTFEQLPIGMKFNAYDPKYPDAQHSEFVKGMLRGISSGLGISYNLLANDLENVNYSSIRAGLLDERENWKQLQSWFVDIFLTPVFSAWLKDALLMGAITSPRGVPLPASKYEKFNKPTWIGRRWAWVDPEGDINANIKARSSGMNTLTRILAEQGLDVEETLKEIANENAMAEKYGISLYVKEPNAPSAPKIN